MASKDLIRAVESYDNYTKENGLDEDVIRDYYIPAIETAIKGENDIKYGLKLSKRVKDMLNEICLQSTWADIFELDSYCNHHQIEAGILNSFYNITDIESPFLFDSYLLSLEKNRIEEERFYSPKREVLIKQNIIGSMQDLEDDVLDILTISAPPGVQKTTTEKFFASWIIGKYLSDYSLFFSHSDDITRMFYDGVLDITTNDTEYRWGELFPKANLQKTDAKRQQINFGKAKAFASLQCTSIGAKNAGKVRCNRYLYCDDLISKQEEALNKHYLDKLWSIYSIDARQRKLNEKVKEIHIATRWSVHDVIGRVQRLYEGSDRVRCIVIPALDPVTGESNFRYKYNGMSKEFFKDQALAMDEISYNALYNGITVEREGLLYNDDELRRYGELPGREPDAILAICDVKNKGTDYMFLPVFYQYDNDYYLVDCVCDNTSNYEMQYSKLSNIILDNNVQKCEFESNNGGDRVSFEVRERVEKAGGRCIITDKPTETNKETRIEVNSDWIKKHILFRSKEDYSSKSDYGIMMGWLLSYTVAGKNDHDDVPDGLANFALFVTNKETKRETKIYRGIL